jgi:hypothetical protein
VKTTVSQLRKLIREEREYTRALNELFGIGEKADFGKMLDSVMVDLQNTNKKLEKAHQVAPQGTARAIVAGLHSDLFNKIAEFRKYVEKLKGLIQDSHGSGAKVAAAEGRRRG